MTSRMFGWSAKIIMSRSTPIPTPPVGGCLRRDRRAFLVIDGRYGVLGAQPTEVFAQALAQAWSESVSA